MCMTRMNQLSLDEPVTVAPLGGFPTIRDLVTDVSFNYEMAKRVPPFAPGPKGPDGTYRMQQADIDRVQEFHNCIECFLCQNVCHVIRDHDENKPSFAGPRMFIRYAELEMHPLDTNDRRALLQEQMGLGMCNITKCCTEVCPERIHITDNAIIPLKERVVDDRYDPIVWLGRKIRRRRGQRSPPFCPSEASAFGGSRTTAVDGSASACRRPMKDVTTRAVTAGTNAKPNIMITPAAILPAPVVGTTSP